MTVEFALYGSKFVALNGGPEFSFTEAISFQIPCADQAEVDHYWDALSEGGEEGPCGWLKDRFGLSWQVVPNRLSELLVQPRPGYGRAGDAGDVHHEEDRDRRSGSSRSSFKLSARDPSVTQSSSWPEDSP